MANTAHFITTGDNGNPMVTVRDDRGAEVTELELPPTASEPQRVDDELLAAGWSRSADWTTASDGWVAPVVPA
ncbi:hypothetical protein SAMN04487905_101232 [Actinopolyspora xinjiangensis]|uniref:Uncharacterized protein n=1 Tax=Actinopolyspora xinjiangensis TaxID=405564 RepID=A0A1H0NSB1_9ACTN|nr:hypothetical protein [Actinopolyspora xinjiangensis]SDO95388.1 hypothetical protein SAMN04487905_101232 [Actinopolyspora xinjiangensis]